MKGVQTASWRRICRGTLCTYPYILFISVQTWIHSKPLRYELAHSPFSHLLVRPSRACIYIMYSLPPPFILPFKFMFYNILINQPVTKMFQKYGEKVIDIFGLNRNMPYFCIRFPRDGKPWNWHSDRNGVGTPTFFFSFALIPTKNTAF